MCYSAQNKLRAARPSAAPFEATRPLGPPWCAHDDSVAPTRGTPYQANRKRAHVMLSIVDMKERALVT